MKDTAEQIEYMINKGQTDRAYDLVKSILFKNRTKSSIIRNRDGKLLTDDVEICDRWKQYAEELYNGENITDEMNYIEQETKVEIDFKGPLIIRSKFDNALEQLKNKKELLGQI